MDFLKDLNLDKVRNLAEDAFNQAKPKTDLEAKVYEVLSHKNWGASSTIMNDIARDSYDHDKFMVITQLMWENMENQRPAAWRVVFKGLTLLEHLIKNGSERCVDDARNHGHSLRALQQFNYYEGTIDRGLGVREKSKQLMEILGDDERIREERQKARKLREKFNGNQGGGIASASKYTGYGNDNWSGGGYGDGGIGSGRYDNNTDSRGYSGRYDDDSARNQPRAPEPTPTFAALPDEQPKKSKLKKKKKKDEAIEPPVEASVDLFSFDAPVQPEDEFNAFQSSEVVGLADPFAATSVSNQQNISFDAFGVSTSHPNHANSLDSYGTSAFQQAQPQNEFVSITDPFASTMPTKQNEVSTVAAPPSDDFPSAITQNQKQDIDDNEFGDFAAAGASSAPKSNSSLDPLSKLISLDGLSKNSNKSSRESKLNEPIIANSAAAAFVNEKDQIQAYVKKGTGGNSTSFQGIDGLHKKTSNFGVGLMPVAGSFNSNVMVGNTGGSVDVISSLDPALMVPQRSQPAFPPTTAMQQGSARMGMSATPLQFQMQGGMGGYGGGMQGGIGANMGGFNTGAGSAMAGMQSVTSGMYGGPHGMIGGVPITQGGLGGSHPGMTGGGLGGSHPGMTGSAMGGAFGQHNGSGGFGNIPNFTSVQGGATMQNNTGMQGGMQSASSMPVQGGVPAMGFHSSVSGASGPYAMGGHTMGFR